MSPTFSFNLTFYILDISCNHGIKIHRESFCLYCDKQIIFKNLETHNKTKHDGKKLNYKTASSKDVSVMFGKINKSQKAVSGESDPSTSTHSFEPPTKMACLESVDIDFQPKLMIFHLS